MRDFHAGRLPDTHYFLQDRCYNIDKLAPEVYSNVLRHSFYFTLILILALFAIGCGGNPATPDVSENSPLSSGRSVSSGPVHHCFGYYIIEADAASMSAEVVPVRSSDWHLNLVGLLNSTMGVSATLIPSQSDPSNGLFVMDISLTHPFGDKTQFTGFDVKGILIGPGTLNAAGHVFADLGETRLLNADGYTVWWNPTHFTQPGILGYTQGRLSGTPPSMLTATVNPYMGYADCLDATSDFRDVMTPALDADIGRAVFTAGTTNTRRFEIQFPTSPLQVRFGYAVDTAWDIPDPNPPEEIPDDFSINANQPEPFYMASSVVLNTLYYDSEAPGGGIGGGTLELDIMVSDWQGLDSGDIGSEILNVFVYAPDLFAGGQSAEFTEDDGTFAHYNVDLTGLASPTHAGDTLVILQAGSSDGSTYKQTPAPGLDEGLAMYQILTLDIPNPDCFIDEDNSFEEATEIAFGDVAYGQVCLAEDESDFYVFEFPVGNILSGQIRLHCEAAITSVSLYDSNEDLIEEEMVTGEEAVISLEGLDPLPGDYYIEVKTENTAQIAPYTLYHEGELTSITPSDAVEITPSSLVVDPKYVWLAGDNAYLAGDLGIWVYDVSVPDSMVEVSFLPSPIPDEATFAYPYLYYNINLGGTSSQVNMIDFTDPSAPLLNEAVLTYTYPVSSLVMNDSNLYVATRSAPAETDLAIYAYTVDPASPTLIGLADIGHVVEMMALLEKDGFDTHIVTATIQTFRSYNVQNPLSVTSAGMYFIPDGYIKDMVSAGGTNGDYLLAAVDADFAGDGVLYVLQQTLVPELNMITSIDLPGSAESIAIEGTYAFIGDGPEGLSVCDISDPTTPVYNTSIGTISLGDDVDVLGNLAAIIPRDAGLQLIDVTNPEEPVLSSRLHVVNTPQAIAADEYYLYAAVGDAAENMGTYYAVSVVDIFSPYLAYVASEFVLGSPPADLWLDSNMLAVAELEGYCLLDITDPLNISEIVTGTPGSHLIEIAFYSDALYMSTAASQLLIYDISSPAAPAAGPILDLDYQCTDIIFVEDHMYLSAGFGIEIYSLADPLDPQYVDSYNLSRATSECKLVDDKLFIVAECLIVILDVSDPSAPVPVGQLDVVPYENFTQIEIEDYFAYMQGPMTVPYAVGLYPIDDPFVVGSIYEHDSYGEVRDLLVLDGILYEASNNNGLRFHDLY